MVRTATAHDLDTAMALYAAAPVRALCPAPTPAGTLRAIAAGELFVLDAENGLAGALVLNRAQPSEYARVDWRVPAAPELVLVAHALCVAPMRRRRGHATELMGFALSRARALGCAAVRLDTWAGNAPACALYEKLGFTCAGAIPVVVDGCADEQVFFEHRV